MTPDQVVRVLDLFGGEDIGALMYRRDGAESRLWIICNDEFYLAASDCEEVMVDDIDDLAAAFADVAAVSRDGAWLWGPLLWVSRKRGRLPLSVDHAYRELFDRVVAVPGERR